MKILPAPQKEKKRNKKTWDETYLFNVDFDNNSVALSIPSNEEEKALNNLNRVLGALDAVNTRSTFKDPLDISGSETYKKSLKNQDDALNSIPDEMATASIPSIKYDDKKEEETNDTIQIGPGGTV